MKSHPILLFTASAVAALVVTTGASAADKTPAVGKKLLVHILAGQSNMQALKHYGIAELTAPL